MKHVANESSGATSPRPRWSCIDKAPPPRPHLLWALQPLLQLPAQLVGRQSELGADPLRSRRAQPQPDARRPAGERPTGGSEPKTLLPHQHGQLWRELSCCKFGGVRGEFRVHGAWGGNGLLVWGVLGQWVKRATLGKMRIKIWLLMICIVYENDNTKIFAIHES